MKATEKEKSKKNKDTVIRARVGIETVKQLEKIKKTTKQSSSEVIRNGIKIIFDNLK